MHLALDRPALIEVVKEVAPMMAAAFSEQDRQVGK
jgi:hypothetical protein